MGTSRIPSFDSEKENDYILMLLSENKRESVSRKTLAISWLASTSHTGFSV